MGWELGLSGAGFLQPCRSLTSDKEPFDGRDARSLQRTKTCRITGAYPHHHGQHVVKPKNI